MSFALCIVDDDKTGLLDVVRSQTKRLGTRQYIGGTRLGVIGFATAGLAASWHGVTSEINNYFDTN